MPRILILDDVDARHQVLARRHAHADREHAASAAEALAALETGRFDLMLLDHDLGEELTGFHVAEHVAALPTDLRPAEVVVHSHNPSGAERMRDLLVAAGIPTRLEPFSSSGRSWDPRTESPLTTMASAKRLDAFLELCRALPDELPLESLIANLRVAGASQAESVAVLRALRGMSVEEGKAAIAGSETWRVK